MARLQLRIVRAGRRAVAAVIHYHGTPIGGTRAEVAEFLIGRHALVPFSRPDDIAIVADVCQSFCLDNGAFTAWKKGGEVDFGAYLAWVREWHQHPGFDWCVIPDVIEGDERANNELLDQWTDEASDIVGVPVWHLHESIDRLVALACRWPRVALGSSGQWASPGAAAWWRRMADAMSAVCDDHGRPMTRLHGLRMLDPEVFTRLPLASADSTNASVNSGSVARFGIYPPPTRSQRAAVIAARIEMHNSAVTWHYPQMDFLA
jgi:hypothetical protein